MAGKPVSGVFATLKWLLVPLVVTLAIQATLFVSVHYVEYDEAVYMDVARNIRRLGLPLRSLGQDGLFAFEHPPLYSYILSALFAVLWESVILARLLTVAFSLGCVVLVFVLVHRYAGSTAAAISALLLGINPFFAAYSYFVRMEILFCFLTLWAFYLIVVWADEGGAGRLGWAGLALAVAVLLKEIMLITTTLLVIYVWLRRSNLRVKLLASAALGLPSLAALLGWGVVAWSLSPTVSTAMLRFWLGAVVGGGSVDAGRMGIGLTTWLITVSGTVLGWSMLALVILASVWALVRRKTLTPLARLDLVYICGLLLSSVLIRLKEPRYVIGLAPAAALWIGVSIDWRGLIAWLRSAASPPAPERRGHRLAVVFRGVAILVLLALVLDASPLRLLPAGQPTKQPGLAWWLDSFFFDRLINNDRYYATIAQAGAYLKAHTSPDTVIAVIHEATVVGYYADRPHIMLYTLRLGPALEALAQTEILVYDHVVFIKQTEAETQQVLDYIGTHFVLEQEIRDDYRRVLILRKRPDLVQD